jgi:hypothetical protein
MQADGKLFNSCFLVVSARPRWRHAKTRMFSCGLLDVDDSQCLNRPWAIPKPTPLIGVKNRLALVDES